MGVLGAQRTKSTMESSICAIFVSRRALSNPDVSEFSEKYGEIIGIFWEITGDSWKTELMVFLRFPKIYGRVYHPNLVVSNEYRVCTLQT